MKTIKSIFAVVMVMGMMSCTSELNDPVVDSSINSPLVTRYHAVEIEASNVDLANLPELSLKEAEKILSNLKNHTNELEELDVKTASKNDMHKWQVIMKHTINSKYSFTIQLNLTSYDDGSLFYNGYSNTCSLSEAKWQVGGFSFSSENASENFKFQSQSHLYMKVFEDNETRAYQIPIVINGHYNPSSHEASFKYTI